MQAVTLVIDLSNVCRDPTLLPVGTEASWDRLSLLLAAIDRMDGVEYSGYYLVADTTLRGGLDRDGKRKLREAESEGYLELQGFADERLVELAFGVDSTLSRPVLVTNDFLDDFRRTFPELDDAHAIAWSSDADGNPRPSLREFGERTHHRMSRKEEEGELRRRRLLRQSVREEASRWYYRCATDGCAIAAFWPERLEELPQYDSESGLFVCPSCAVELIRGEARQPAVQVIVFKDQQEVARLLIETGVEIGRLDSAGCLGLERFLKAEDVRAISWRHLRIYVEGEEVYAEDVKSKNGAVLKPRMHGRPEKRLTPGARVRWGLRDAIVLP